MRKTVHSLLAAWAMLMALTLALALAADVGHASRLGPIWIGLIALVAVVKARIVLGAYLGLNRAPSALSGFTSAVVIALAIVVASFVFFPTPAHRLAQQPTSAALAMRPPSGAFDF